VRRLLLVDDGPGIYGSQRCIVRIAPFLHAAGYETALLAPRGSELADAWDRIVGGPVYRMDPVELSVRSASGALAPLAGIRTSRRLAARSRTIAAAIRESAANVVIANSYWAHFDVPVAARIARVPSVLYLHEYVPPGLPVLAHRAAIRLSQGAIAVSHGVAGVIGKSSRITIIHNGVDTSIFSPGTANSALRAELAQRPDQPLVVVICRIDEGKQVDHVIRAVNSLDGPLASTGLVIVGATTDDQTYANEIQRLGAELLGDRVRFVGQREDVADILRSADLHVLASRSEGFGLTIVEAQATGCPVVAYSADGLKDVIADGRTGVFAELNNWHALAYAMSAVLLNPSYRDKLVENALGEVRSKFSLEAQGDAVVALLDSVVAPEQRHREPATARH
jgi:glycosyltransferase involved in cell wall biosynthesis